MSRPEEGFCCGRPIAKTDVRKAKVSMAVSGNHAGGDDTIPVMNDAEVASAPSGYEPGEAGFGALSTERGLFPLRSVQVAAKISALSCHVTLHQTFVNTFDSPLEATYIFPLPSEAAVTSFRLEVKDRVIEAVVKELGDAREEYDQAVRSGYRAAIAEEQLPGVFSVRVGNIAPREVASVRLTLAAPLPFRDGEATFRFPLVVAPRYIPSNGLDAARNGSAADTHAGTPDMSRSSPPVMLPGFEEPVQLGIENKWVKRIVSSRTFQVLDTGQLPAEHSPLLFRLATLSVRSSLHTISVYDTTTNGPQGSKSPSAAIRRLRLDPKGDRRLNRDFILRFNVTDPANSPIATSLALSDDPGDESEEGTWQLTLLSAQNGGVQTNPRDVVFVLDRSGSMAGWKIEAARAAMARIGTLTEDDRFSLLAFDNEIETPDLPIPDWVSQIKSRFERPSKAYNPSLVAATEPHRRVATEFLSKVNARGGTEMLMPLETGAAALTWPPPGTFDSEGFLTREAAARPRRHRVLVLMTDAQIQREDAVIGALGQQLQGTRIFAVGIDQAVNEGFLTRLAALGAPGGLCELVESRGRLDAAAARIERLMCAPALTDVQIDGLKADGIEMIRGSVTPRNLGGVFPGVPFVIRGRYRKTRAQEECASAPVLTVSGRTAAGESWTQVAAAHVTPNPALRALWGRAAIRELDDQSVFATVALGKDAGGLILDLLRARILELSLRCSVLSRFSAYVAVDRSEKVEPGTWGTAHVTQPVEVPAGWENVPVGTALRLRPRTGGFVQCGDVQTPRVDDGSGIGRLDLLSDDTSDYSDYFADLTENDEGFSFFGWRFPGAGARSEPHKTPTIKACLKLVERALREDDPARVRDLVTSFWTLIPHLYNYMTRVAGEQGAVYASELSKLESSLEGEFMETAWVTDGGRLHERTKKLLEKVREILMRAQAALGGGDLI
ncbi:hypothetical protein KFL_003200020 [Klebsormidium nitens]|uniref:Uncharacterized protein n=1 Tax=Klebsormidium nitens TaxID=105231 RepID=A0A1Y1I7I2_KLENI|nr:hypothetical protein KFL_003200020 [Klebsormidium nitens]|eukprot:GAQ86910.1 hypothetical protein KFL_003200020 [Klebsormidium nitens]